MNIRLNGWNKATLAAAIAVLGIFGVAKAEQALTDNPLPPNNVTFTGDGTTVGINDDGNIIRYESPPGYEHVGVGAFSEGYVLCYDIQGVGQVARYDVGLSPGVGFGSPGTVPNGNFVDRTTVDGLVKFHQKFSFNPPRNALKIRMKVKNQGNVSLQNSILRRQVDFDTDTGGSLGWAGFLNWHANDTKDSAFAWNAPDDAPSGREAHKMTLNHWGGVSSRRAKVTRSILDRSCSPVSIADNGPVFGDHGETLQYNLGTLGPGQSKTVIVEYQRH